MACTVHTIQKRASKLVTIEEAFDKYRAATRYREKHHKLEKKFRNYSKIRKCANYPSIRKSRKRREYKLFHQMIWQFAICMKMKKPHPSGYDYGFIHSFEAWLRYYMTRKDYRITDVKLFKGDCCREYENDSMAKFQNEDVVQNCSICNPTISKYSFSHNDSQVLHLHHCYKGIEVEQTPDSDPDTDTNTDINVSDESSLSDSLLEEPEEV